MRKFFKENKIFLAIIIGALVIGGAIIISNWLEEPINKNREVVGDCPDIPELPDMASRLVLEIIDGDTLIIEGDYSVRILGIDADERGEPCYKSAKNRLEELILNKEVKLEKGKEDKDQWCRYLRYVFLGDQNVSLALVKEGLVIARFSPEDVKYREKIAQAEKIAKENKMGCQWAEKVVEKIEEERGQASQERTIPLFQWKKLTSELTGLKKVDACRAKIYLGKEAIIEGRVVDTYRHLRSNIVFLNFERPFPNQCFTGVIFDSNLYKFVQNPEDYYLNKAIRIKGEIKQHRDRPQIILETPNQIEIGD